MAENHRRPHVLRGGSIVKNGASETSVPVPISQEASVENVPEIDRVDASLQAGAQPIAVSDAVPQSSALNGDRDRTGRFTEGNQAALRLGEHSAAFWRAQEAARCEFVARLLADHGVTADTAPIALVAAAESLAQATLLRDAAFLRIAEGGGPTSTRGNRRVAMSVWLDAADRLERLVKLIGLQRVERPMPSIAEVLQDGGGK